MIWEMIKKDQERFILNATLIKKAHWSKDRDEIRTECSKARLS